MKKKYLKNTNLLKKAKMETEKLNLMKEFRQQLVNFLDEIIDQFPYEGDFVLIRMFIKDQIPVADILGRFIRDLLPFKKVVREKDESFFLNNTILYTGGKIGSDKIDHFKNLWLSDKMDDSDRETIWQWMNLFVDIAESYHKKFGYIKGWEK